MTLELTQEQVVRGLRALAQTKRLEIFRLLIQAAPEGLAAGFIGKRLGLCCSTLSFHLARLENANLIHSKRESRNIYYRADPHFARDLLGLLLVECCSQSWKCGGIAALNAAAEAEGSSNGGADFALLPAGAVRS